MALEDAIEAARKAASWEEQRLRNARARKAAQDTELKAVLAEAVNRLRSFEGLTLRRYEPCTSWFGADGICQPE